MIPQQRFKRNCTKCNKSFRPTGKYQKLCDDCKTCPGSKDALKKRYFQCKEQLDIIRSNETLAKWKALSKAYSLGKRIYGSGFTRQRLAFDMEIPMTTTLRCLALDRANKKTWRLINSGKISAFKVAYICQTKSITFQDEIINLVIKENYSIYRIKQLRINNLKDIDKEKLRLEMEPKFSKKGHAARSFEIWIEKGKLLLLINEKALSKEKYTEIKEELRGLSKRIERYCSNDGVL